MEAGQRQRAVSALQAAGIGSGWVPLFVFGNEGGVPFCGGVSPGGTPRSKLGQPKKGGEGERGGGKPGARDLSSRKRILGQATGVPPAARRHRHRTMRSGTLGIGRHDAAARPYALRDYTAGAGTHLAGLVVNAVLLRRAFAVGLSLRPGGRFSLAPARARRKQAVELMDTFVCNKRYSLVTNFGIGGDDGSRRGMLSQTAGRAPSGFGFPVAVSS